MTTEVPRYLLSAEERAAQRAEDRQSVLRYRQQGMSARRARTQVWYDRHIGRFNR